MLSVLMAKTPALPLPEGDNQMLLYSGAGVGIFVLLVIVIFTMRGRKKVDPEEGLREDLGAIPEASDEDRNYQLYVMNQPVRLRLVVIAPVGKKPLGKPETVLEQVCRNLGEVTLDDKPRVRVWPPQLSTAGFAPTFTRLIQRPEAAGKASRWVLLAGPARAGGAPILLGLAVQADSPVKLGHMHMSETQWAEVLRVEGL